MGKWYTKHKAQEYIDDYWEMVAQILKSRIEHLMKQNLAAVATKLANCKNL